MPSIQKIILGLALFHACSAIPFAAPAAAKKPVTKALSIALPTSGDATELPGPSGTLLFVAVGRGIQNYSCSAVGAAPVSIGAVANLYDATSIASSNIAELHTIPGLAVDTPPDRTGCFVLPAQYKSLPLLGKHFFLADGTPTFILESATKTIQAAKNTSIAAPPTAPTSPSGNTAVAWLQLNAKPSPYVSLGLSQVYRVETAGGNPNPTCTSTAVMSIQYSAEYWFYEPTPAS